MAAKRTLGWLACAASGGVLLAAPASVSAYCRMTTVPAAAGACDSEGVPLHWEKRCIAYQISADGLPEFLDPAAGMGFTEETLRSTLSQAWSTWTALECRGRRTGLEVRIDPGTNNTNALEYLTDGPNVSAIVFMKRWQELGYDSAAYARTTTWHNPRTGQIVDTDMELNQRNYLFYDCGVRTCQNFDVDLSNVLVHEAGHSFGLGHSNVSASTMYFSAPPTETSKRSLEADDIEGFCASYGDADLPAECDFSWVDNTDRGGGGGGGGCSITEAPARSSLLWIAALAALLVRRKRRQ